MSQWVKVGNALAQEFADLSPGGPTIINTVLQIYLNVTVWE